MNAHELTGVFRALRRLRIDVLRWLWRDPRRPLRLGLFLEAAGWSVQLGLPTDTFATSHVYDLMARWLPEWGWATVFGADAVFLATGFLLPSRRRVRVYSAIVDAAAHATVVYSAIRSAPAATGVVTQVMFLLASWLLMEWEAMDA